MFFFFFFFTDETNKDPQPLRKFSEAEWQNTANKGEWSELYTLYKLLADQNLFPIDNKQKEGERLRLPILSILRFTEECAKSCPLTYVEWDIAIRENDCVLIEANSNARSVGIQLGPLHFRKKQFDELAELYDKSIS